MAFVKGHAKVGGRKPGQQTKARQAIRDRLESMGCDCIGYLAHTVMNNIPCAVCRGKGKTKFQPGKSEAPGERVCQSCWGEKLERIDPKASQAAAGTLLEYCETKLKAIEVSGKDGGPVITERVMRLTRLDEGELATLEALLLKAEGE